MKIFSCILLLLCVSVSSGANEPDEVSQDEVSIERQKYTCGTEKLQGVKFNFCYRNQEATNNNDIVYFFHGLNGSEDTWFTQCLGTLMIQRWWQFKGYKPRIVGISFGPSWLLVNNKRFPILPLFAKGIIPLMEKKMGGLNGGRRHIIGQSMGGFNGAEIALQYPEMFSRVALLCPAITAVGPYSSNQEIDNYIYRTHAIPRLVRKMLSISRSIFLNQKDWENHDPIRLLKNFKGKKKPKFYVSIGIWDSYGFQEGAEEFSALASAMDFFSSWVPVPGPHCNFNRRATANFIMGD
ncbi:alpha/beta hydrolase-fold protein [Bdellovibrio sp. HCB-162]|uniref:alpha/beta hydrolase-fold protein n=1 Tax=Bdellovibrio sp. HCB-162 TaxID=3394234 RepID=UPI0039BCBC02